MFLGQSLLNAGKKNMHKNALMKTKAKYFITPIKKRFNV